MSDIDYITTMNVFSVGDNQSSSGGMTEVDALKHENVPCTIELASGSERELLGREGIIYTHNLFCDPITLEEKDVVKIDGQEYDVIRADDIQSRGHHMENLVEERR